MIEIDRSLQQVALQYRVGNTGNFTNIPAAYIADATTGPNLATLVSAINITLPPDANNQPAVYLRIMKTNAPGNDEWVGIDDISVTGTCGGGPGLSINDVSVTEGNAGTVSAQFSVTLSAPAGAGGVTFDIATADNTATLANNDYVANSLVGQTIAQGSSGPFLFNVTVNGDPTVEPNETFFVNVSNVVGATVIDGQGQGTISNDDFVVTPIHDIQGPGASSPLVGQVVTTTGIIYAVKNNGFFMQEPDASVDADPASSEGIIVFTSAAPPASAAVGNLVRVSATVTEFVPASDPLQPPLSELSFATITQLSAGNPLPAATPLTAAFPSPAGVFDQLERLEGMRVSVASLTVNAPTDGNVNEPNASSTTTGVFFGMVSGSVAGSLRESGIQHPDPPPAGTIPPIPRWDGNPEVLRVDSDALFDT